MNVEHIYKIGIDIHGVLDSDPIWKDMAYMFMQNGHEVHIITGSLFPKALSELKKLGLKEGTHYSHLFSISDSLIMKGEHLRYNVDNTPSFDNDAWDREKGLYCTKHNISMHFDDTPRYANHFTTPICIKQIKKDA